MGYKSVVRGWGGIEEGEEEVVSSIPGGAGFPASILWITKSNLTLLKNVELNNLGHQYHHDQQIFTIVRNILRNFKLIKQISLRMFFTLIYSNCFVTQWHDRLSDLIFSAILSEVTG